MVCPNCGTANPNDARFCSRCGHALEAAALSPSEPGATTGERRIVTMLFCDVVGSTAAAERLDPEEWAEVMNRVFETMTAPIQRFDGTLARLMGDAIFAFFGAPVAHEDDPHRAVSAGLAIVEAMHAYQASAGGADGALDVRVGINTGPVVVGEVGSEQRTEYTAMGDAVNVAARMEQTAEPGTVHITDETYRLVRERFEVAPALDVTVKGKTEPVTAYRVLGPRATPGAARALGAAHAPLVGRDREMAVLCDAVDRALAGEGGLIALIGDAGLGKSRLIEETRTYWAARDSAPPPAHADVRRIWEAWQCVSYDAARPYAQYRRMLSTIAQIADTDPPEVVRIKLAATVEAGAPEWLEPHMRVWRSLFGVPDAEEQLLEGEAFRRAITDLVPRSTRHFGWDPRLLVFEDLHWCDDASMDLLIETAGAVQDQPSLLVFAFRPDADAPSWRLHRWIEEHQAHRATQLVLAPLTSDASAALLDELLPAEARAEARTGILERTEGNPLFLEELSAAVASDDRLSSIPPSLQALITARLDTLDVGARRTLQLASVIGRTFSEPVLAAVEGDGSGLVHRLAALETADLIRPVAGEAAPTYAFHHSLTQEAAYGTILKRERRELHGRVGAALEGLYAQRVEEFAPVLAAHFRDAGDDGRTLRYAQIAGDAAARLYANTDAVRHYADAIGAGRRLGEHDVLFAHLYPSRGRALELAGRFDEAVANDEAWEQAAVEAGDQRAELGAAMTLTTLYATPTPAFDFDRGTAAAEQSVALAREVGDRAAEAKALWNLMNAHVFGGGDGRAALEAGQRSLSLAREADDREQIAFTASDLWRPYTAIGDLAAASATLAEGRAIWREFDDRPMVSENLTSASALSRLRGDDDEALALAREALEISEGIANLWGQAYAAINIFGVELDRGEVGAAISTMLESIDLAERSGFIAPQATTRSTLAETYAYLGDLDRARDVATVAMAVARDRLPSAIPWALSASAETSLAAGDLDGAAAALDDSDADVLPEPLRSTASVRLPLLRARVAAARGDLAGTITIARSVLDRLDAAGIRPYAAESLLVMGRAHAASGEGDQAAAALRDARDRARRLGHTRILWEIDVALARLAGDAERGTLDEEARAIVRRIADSVDPGLRALFVARPEVAAVLE
jgi:class 3 adenylate cyclase/tetratricopeptide (TPR) repeat protein